MASTLSDGGVVFKHCLKEEVSRKESDRAWLAAGRDFPKEFQNVYETATFACDGAVSSSKVSPRATAIIDNVSKTCSHHRRSRGVPGSTGQIPRFGLGQRPVQKLQPSGLEHENTCRKISFETDGQATMIDFEDWAVRWGIGLAGVGCCGEVELTAK